MNPAQVLEAAADYIDVHGHCKGVGSSHERRCLWGAIHSVTNAYGSGGIRYAALTVVASFVGIDEPHEHTRLTRAFAWNDAPERTKDEVTSAMRGAAALWQAQHEEPDHVEIAQGSTQASAQGRRDEARLDRAPQT